MYFWNLEKLKTEMAERPLTDREVLPYVVVTMTLWTAAFSLISLVPDPESNVWDVLSAIWSVGVTLGGTIYIYLKNGAADGSFFLQRYFAVGWVVGVRWTVILVALTFFVYFGALMAGRLESDSTQWYEFLMFAGWEAAVWERTGHHVGDLSRKAVRSNGNESGDTEQA